MSDSCALTRRRFIAGTTAAGVLTMMEHLRAGAASPRPNILWIVSEDNNPYLGCYGDKVARTPVIDALAARGVLFENCFSTAPVCAPSRFTLISGMYATCCGPANHMRAQGRIPAFLRGFPAYLRDAGYYCTNNSKTDYNAPINMKDTWDESSRQAHWRNRPGGKPFFAVFNHEVTHESRVFPAARSGQKPLDRTTDPASVRLPAYHPDTPEFRADRAHYYDQMARLDEQVGRLLAALKEDGLAEDTIVFYYSDNGGVLPRSKRFPYDSGTHVPLIIYFPEKFRHLAPAAPGSRIDWPVNFVDFAPTVLNLAGVPIPQYMQGRPFAGPGAAPRDYSFSFRDRMDERYDMIRTVRDRRYRYLRNYMPHLPWGQYVSYMFQQQSVKVWHRLYKEGKLSGPQKTFWEEKPAEELYDLQTDPDEVNNLAGSAQHQEILQRMRAALRRHLVEVRDNGFIPEGSDLEGYDASRNERDYPVEAVIDAAEMASRRDPANLPKLVELLDHANECMRWWGALGCVMLRQKAAPAAAALLRRLDDSSGSVQVAAAEALCWTEHEQKGVAALAKLATEHPKPRVRLQAMNALDHIGDKARLALPAIEKACKDTDNYVVRAAKTTAALLKGQEPAAE